ncbi:hypothetical protein BDZ85DRAFT_270584 [Elsinoe ampelina]|uniref:Uncharacterized protein n=1 Tax=Elsinoe ampelina TaxID=302913 RepID=A0A6A6FYC6_9PEZI|nr:hypothetical protein BDZ85DRAFT_270584 [Elsinoe ampelina]
MSAVLVKGIIISLSLAAAVGIALQSPEVKEWLEEQRRRLAELLRNVSEGLDPQTRREAEAFAYEGLMPTPQEREGIVNATAVATGRETEDTATARRMNRQSSSNPIDAEERRRLGREYLAKRNQELLDMRKKRESEQAPSPEIESTMETGIINEKEPMTIREKSNSVGSFDHLIHEDGSLRMDEKRVPLTPGSPVEVPAYVESVKAPVAVRALEAGYAFGNPFADEFAMSDDLQDRSVTPKPPVPPKIAIGSQSPAITPVQAAADVVEDPPEQSPSDLPEQATQDLSYDEQLARALSISLAESEAAARSTIRRTTSEQEDFERAIAESLREATRQAANDTPTREAPSGDQHSSVGPLVDLSHNDAPPKSNNPFRQRSEDDDLYSLTPAPTGARAGPSMSNNRAQYPDIAKFLSALQSPTQDSTKYDFPDVPTGTLRSPSGSLAPATPQAHTEDNFPPAPAAVRPSPPVSATLSPSLPPQDALSTAYHTESEADEFASLPDTSSQSEGSLVEVEDVDIESMSDDDDGIHTPRSWSEVGSDVGDSERSESEAGDLVRV